MGGVDLNDQAVSTYRIHIKGKKWWWVLFTHMLNVCMTNAWKLQQIVAGENEKLNQLQFTRYITRHYLLTSETARKKRRPSMPNSVSIRTISVIILQNWKNRYDMRYVTQELGGNAKSAK